MIKALMIVICLFSLSAYAADNPANAARTTRGVGSSDTEACNMSQTMAGIRDPSNFVCGVCEVVGGTHACEYTTGAGPSTTTTRPPQCGEMIRYRDTQLAGALKRIDFSGVSRKSLLRTSQTLANLQLIKKQSLEARKNQTLVNAGFQIVLILQLQAKVFQDVMKILPGVSTTATTIDKIADIVNKVAFGQGMVNALGSSDGEFEAWGFMYAVKKVPTFGPALAAVYDAGRGLQKIKDQSAESDQILGIMDAAVVQFEKQIILLESELKSRKKDNLDVVMINEIKNNIDSVCY